MEISGSGGGGYSSGGTYGYGYNPSTPSSVTPNIPSPHPYGITQGNPGGSEAGGGGGAGGAGSPGNGGKGGIGTRTSIAGPNYPIGTPAPGGAGGYLLVVVQVLLHLLIHPVQDLMVWYEKDIKVDLVIL